MNKIQLLLNKNRTGIAIMLFLVINAFWAKPVLAQDMKITGKIVSETDEPLPGVTLLVKGTTNGTITDIDGNFSLMADKNATLKISYIGYSNLEIPVNGRSIINIKMEPDLQQLDEVVVIGYGTQRKSHLTGAVSKVTNKKLDQIPLSRVDDALTGRVSGVNIQMTNPEAGGEPTIRVRGIGSITSFPNPLIVVDGIVVDQDYLGGMDMNDVESIEVLKDAASSSIYGSRGANGVILVTTKTGKVGPTKFSYNGYVGTKSIPSNDVLSTISDWNAYVRANNNGELPDKLKYIELLGTETNWEEVMMDGGTIANHSLAARGGTDKTKFSASGNFLKDGGVLLTDSYEKINFRLNLDTRVNDRLEFGLRINPSYSKQRRFPIGLHDAIRQSPYLPEYLDENTIQFVNRVRESERWGDAQIGDYPMERMFDDYDLATGTPVESGGTDISTTSNVSPLAKVLERSRFKYQTRIFTNAYLKFKIAKGIKLRSSIGGNFKSTRNENFQGVLAHRNGAEATNSFDSRSNQFHLVTEHLLNFKKGFGDHDISAVAGFAYEMWDYNYSEISGIGYDFDYINTIANTNVSGASTLETQKSLVSIMGRVNYAYADKYLVSFSLRRDGSSKFGANNRYGFFPAVSAGWRISEEPFLSSSSIVSNLKLRVSYGVTGSDGDDRIIGRYPHIGQVVPVGAVVNGSIVNGFNQVSLSNPELQWEKSVEFNPGIDIGLLDDRFGISIDVYQRKSVDLLLNRPVPSVTGFTSAIVNLGEVENKGIEIEFTSNNIRTNDIVWSTSANLSYNKNTLADMAGADGLISTVDSKRPAEWIAKEGHPVASFYGYVVDKEIDLNYIKNPFYPINGESQDIYVKDLNGDGIIDADDRTFLGSPYPKVIWSVNNTITYKNFDISFMFQGSHGAKVRNMDPQYVNNQFSSNQDYITDTSDPNFFPDADKVVQRIFTNDIVMDASYVALRNFNVGYTIPNDVSKKVGLTRARIYVGAQNLFYLMGDDYRGYNPEGINQGLDSPLTYGYQRGAAPIYKTWNFGVNLEF